MNLFFVPLMVMGDGHNHFVLMVCNYHVSISYHV